ncbi:preprotein translocase subunit YajC [Microbacterium oleivorans]|uniref:preprotein translocase subunit YajC n=1 Tax=Microbacterium oleivorans TaxID=273677 RepID=UPI00080E54BA|nr:preprotein translocase subunit YajC [Microbacterium oleivorans]
MLLLAQQNTPQAPTGGNFFTDYGLLILLAALLVFMFISSRRRTKKMKEQQEQKAQQMVPGVKVLLQGGLYGTIVEYDPTDLSKPAHVELAPGMVVEVHSQAILRIVEDEEPVVEETEQVAGDDVIVSRDETILDSRPVDGAPDADDKPKA